MIDIETETETQKEGEAGSMPGAGRGTRSRDSRLQDHALSRRRRQTAEPPGDPLFYFLFIYFILFLFF